ncbi:MAG: type II toxin-antitoxin system HicB family antitoxin [Rhabdochlamydiaceae bacterium]
MPRLRTKYILIIILCYDNMEISQKSRKFTILVNKEKEGGYSGQCLELPGAISQGETLEELKTNMADAINLVLEYIKDRAKKEKSKIMEITT